MQLECENHHYFIYKCANKNTNKIETGVGGEEAGEGGGGC